jgi:glyoxylase-like metal-dependent hydrolase (beta-lactamase superfamily II)
MNPDGAKGVHSHADHVGGNVDLPASVEIVSHEVNRLFLNDVRAARAQGKTPDEIAAAWKVPNGYTGYTAALARIKENAQKIAEETKR